MGTQSTENLLSQIEELQNRLAEAEQLIEAIKAGEVDAFAVSKNDQHEVFTIQSGDYAYRVLVETFSEGAVNLSEDGLIVYSNTSFHEILNLTYDNVIGKSIFQFIHPDSQENFKQLFKKGLTEQSKGEINLIVGNIVYPVSVSLTSLSPTLPTVGMVVSDLRERKEHEQTLAQNKMLEVANKAIEDSEKRYNMMLMQSPFAFAIFSGKELIITLANARMKEVLGKGNDIENKPLLEVLPELIGQPFAGYMHTVMETGVPFYANEALAKLTRNGKLEDAYFNFVYQPYQEVDGSISGITCIAYEVTNEVLAKKKIEESRTYYQTLTDNTPVMTWITGPDGYCTYLNKQWYEYTGQTPQTGLGMGWLSAVHPEDVKQTGEIFMDANDRQIAFSLVYRLKNKNGEYLWYLDKGLPKFDPEGNFEGFVGSVTDIQDSVVARQKIEESEKKYRLLFNSMDEGFCVIEFFDGPHGALSDYVHVEANPAYTLNAGIPDIVGKKVREMVPDEADGWVEIYRNVLLTGKSILFERELLATGRHLELAAFRIEPQEAKQVAVLFKDITERKKAEEVTRQSEKEFRQITEAIPQLVWVCNPQGEVIYFNRQWYTYTGTVEKDVMGHQWATLVHPDDVAGVLEKWNHAQQTVTPISGEYRLKSASGEYHWVLSQGTPILDEKGDLQKWFGGCTFIDEQKEFSKMLEKKVDERTVELTEINQTLAESENRIQTIFEAAPDAVITINHEGVITNWNEEAESIFGWKKLEVFGKTLAEIIIPERYRELHTNGLKNFMRTGEGNVLGKPIEIEALKKDRSEIPVELKISASIVNDLSPVFIGFVRDISKRKKAEKEIAQKNSALEKMNKELESFTYISSHDLQEPLRKIQTFASRIIETENQNLSDTGKDYFRRMQDAAKRMQTLIQDLLSFSRINASERQFELTDLRVIVEDVKSDFREVMAEKDSVIEIGEMNKLKIIPFQFRQLFQNLIGNALKFSKADTPPRIEITSEIINGNSTKASEVKNLSPEITYCHITFTDNGIGFEQHFSEQIFEVFQKLHGKELYTGTGIGLAIVKKIVENHNGIITAHSELGKGARFDIYIPVK